MQLKFQFRQITEPVGEPHEHDMVATWGQSKNVSCRQFKAVPGRLHCRNAVGADFVAVQLDPSG